MCAVAAPVLGQLVSGTRLLSARFRGLEASFLSPGVRLDAAPVNFGLLSPAGTRCLSQMPYQHLLFCWSSVLGRSPMMLSQMLLQLLLPTVITACCGKKAMFLQHCKTVLSGPSE